MRKFKTLCLAGAAGLAVASAASAQSVAPGAPGDLPTWSSAAKTGAGASYERTTSVNSSPTVQPFGSGFQEPAIAGQLQRRGKERLGNRFPALHVLL